MRKKRRKKTMNDSSKKDLDLFPGCVIQNRIPFIEKSARFVFDKLGYTFYDQPFTCCPDPVGMQSTEKTAWLTMGANNLTMSEKSQHPIISLCNGCSETLLSVKHELKYSKHERDEVNVRLDKIGKKYVGTAEIRHFVEFLGKEVGTEEIKKHVVRPLNDLNIAMHVGCHYARPSKLLKIDDPINPVFPRRVLEAIGCNIIEYEQANLCCGAGVARNTPVITNGIMKRKFESLSYAAPDFLAVNCPTCYLQLDNGQQALKKEYGMETKLPIMYITELMALAFGATIDEIGLKFHRVKPNRLLKEKNIK